MIEPIREMSTGKKVALAVGTAAAVGAVGVAFATGRKTDAFVKAAEAVKNGVEGAKKLNVFQTIGEGFKDIGQFLGYSVNKLKAGFIKGAPDGKEVTTLTRLKEREGFASGLTKRFIEKHGSFFKA